MSDTPAAATEQFEIHNRWSGKVQFTAEIAVGLSWRAKMGAAVKWAFSRAADLRAANLCGANLCGANLRAANLCGANLRAANLCAADLRDANLRAADLRGTNLYGANLRAANLCGADLRDANLRVADLRGAPAIPNIDACIVAQIDAGGTLDMSEWHGCGTSHCRAGWAITLAGEAGARLEASIGAAAAGALIYAASRPDKPVPDFYCSDEAAIADLRACAAEQGDAA